MPAIIGYIGNPSADIAQHLQAVRGNYPYVYQEGFLTILANSALPTMFISGSAPGRKWIVIGNGIQHTTSSSKFMGVEDWDKLLGMNSADVSLKKLNGHFLLLCWDGNRITFHTDPTGLKSFYLHQTNDGILFSDNHDFSAGWLNPG